MADAVATNVVFSSPKQYVVHLTNLSDGTGETAVVKVNRSALLAMPVVGSTTAAAPASLDIEQVRWAMQGITAVKIAWDHSTPDTALLLPGAGFEDFTGRDGLMRDVARMGGLKDPRSAGGTGNITLTTIGAASGGTYDITLTLTLTP